MQSRKWVIGGILLVVIVSLLGLAMNRTDGPGSTVAKGKLGGGAIAVIRIEGVITGSGGSDLFGNVTSGGARLQETLRQVAQDDSVKAVVLRVNSPGGSAPAAQEIGDQIDKIRESGKVVVTSMGEVAASGGYWIAAKSDKIVANPATMTGSIGVIMEMAQLTELYNKIGYKPQVFKSGPHKDMGNPARDLTEEEKKIFQSMIDDIYGQFVDVVAKGRSMPRERVIQLADGRIYTGRQAKDLGLVDQLGNYYDAIDLAKELAGIKGDVPIQEYGKGSPWERLFGEVRGALTPSKGLSPGDVEKLLRGLGLDNSLPGGIR